MLSTQSSRRRFLTQVAGGTGAFALGGRLFAEDSLFSPADFGDVQSEVDAAFADKVRALPEFELPNQVNLGGGQMVNPGFAWDGQSSQAPPAGTVWTHPTRDGGASAMVNTLTEAKQAASIALASGNYDQVQIMVPRIEQGTNEPRIIWDKDGNGFVKPDLVYRKGDQVSFLTPSVQEEAAAAAFETQLATLDFLGQRVMGHDGDWLSNRVASHDRQLWLPGDYLAEPKYQYVGLFGNGNGLFGRRQQQQQGQGNCQPCQYPGYSQCQDQQQCGSYGYTSNCRTGNCNLSVGSTIGGLFRGEFLRPIRRNLTHLPIGQRLIARIFPRVAYRKGWIDCETAHVLLVKRLFVIIVAGIIAGTAGGGGAAGLIFIP